jgi:hypothetical protein
MNGLYLKELFLALVILGFIILLIISFKTGCNGNNKEGWVNYQSFPFGQITTAYSDPITLYACPEYRLPYNWPIGVKRSFPEEHIAPLKMGVL